MQAVDSIQEKSWIDRMADEPVSIEDSIIDADEFQTFVHFEVSFTCDLIDTRDG